MEEEVEAWFVDVGRTAIGESKLVSDMFGESSRVRLEVLTGHIVDVPWRGGQIPVPDGACR